MRKLDLSILVLPEKKKENLPGTVERKHFDISMGIKYAVPL